MAVMSDADRARAARITARKLIADGSAAAYTHADLLASVVALDNVMEDTAANLPGTAGQTVAARINLALPAPFSGASQAQRALLAGITFGVKYGYLTTGGE